MKKKLTLPLDSSCNLRIVKYNQDHTNLLFSRSYGNDRESARKKSVLWKKISDQDQV